MVSVMNDTRVGRTPWHLWAVGLLGIAWNGFGCVDYTMTALQGEVWLRNVGMTDAAIAAMEAFPAWMTAAWAIGVWGGLAGAVLLLFKSKLAFPVFVLSLVAYLASQAYSYGFSDMGDAMPEGSWIMSVVVFTGCLFFVWYSRMMAKRGVLR